MKVVYSSLINAFVFSHLQHGRHRFVVLLTDMLLIMKSRRLSQAMLFSPGSHLDWFSDQDCTAKMVILAIHTRSTYSKHG